MSGQIVLAREAQQNLKSLLEKAKPSIAAVLPKHLTPDRLLKIALSATSRQPALLECSPDSILKAVMQAADLGLEPNTPLGLSYLVPYRNSKSKRMEAQLIPGYRGLVKLAIQSGEIKNIHARAIHARDTYTVEYGMSPVLVHRPCLDGEPGELVAVYSVVEFRDGGRDFEFMTRAEVDKIRARSMSANAGPWISDFEEMAKKTVLRRHCKTLPLSPELARALEHQARAESGEAPDFSDVIVDVQLEGTAEAAAPAPANGAAAKLKAKLTAQSASPAEADPVVASAPVAV